jgi:hypothetical protein
MDLRRATFVTLLALLMGCATRAPAPAAVARPPAEPPKRFPDLLEEQPPCNYSANEKSDTPECRARFDDFNKTWKEAGRCERDDDCTYLIGKCTSMRADFKPVLEKKLQDLGTCLDILMVPICKDTRAICFDKRCRVRGQEDKAE